MSVIVVSHDRLEEVAWENPGTEIHAGHHVDFARVGDMLYIARPTTGGAA